MINQNPKECQIFDVTKQNNVEFQLSRISIEN